MPKPLKLLDRVVMYRAHTHHTAALLHPQLLGDVECVVVAIPHRDTFLVQFFRHPAGVLPLQVEGEGGARCSRRPKAIMNLFVFALLNRYTSWFSKNKIWHKVIFRTKSTNLFEGPAPTNMVAKTEMNDELPIFKQRIAYDVSSMNNINMQRDLVYKSAEATDLKLDIYTPQDLYDNVRLPGMVFIHGGPLPPPLQLQAKDMGQYLSWGELAAASGLVGVTFNHRYHDFTDLEQADSDVIAVFEYVRQRADDFHLDPDRLCLWACSGGGPFLHFALQERHSFIRCLVIYYAMLDLRSLQRISQGVSGETLEKFSPVAYFGTAFQNACIWWAE